MNTTNTKDIEIENAWGKTLSIFVSNMKMPKYVLQHSMDRGLKVHCYFELFSTRSLEVRHHVYTEQRGLVCGGSDGSIAITKFQDWEPQQSRTIGRMNGGEVSALTTRGDLIAAASTSGEVALWNYEGLKIATVEVKGSSIRDLSIRDTNLLVVSNGDAYEFNLPMPTNANTIPSVLKLKKGAHHNLDKQPGLLMIQRGKYSARAKNRCWQSYFAAFQTGLTTIIKGL
ncbi:hypothetical protein B0O99DRAFT_706204 [Bisporella sp. PMI_857]|nr:hypothetical protein B0O99DRAFT_706204 [Bisporella sp. PMI_857]